jgi:hypothetical protein
MILDLILASFKNLKMANSTYTYRLLVSSGFSVNSYGVELVLSQRTHAPRGGRLVSYFDRTRTHNHYRVLYVRRKFIVRTVILFRVVGSHFGRRNPAVSTFGSPHGLPELSAVIQIIQRC